jgi:hypothetical protein
VDLTALINGLVTPGIIGDTETLTNISAVSGSVVLNNNGTVSYTAPTSGPDTLTYTVEDQYNDQATGTANITVDPGPTAATGTDTVGHNKTVDLTALINGLVTPGIIGDTETLTNISAVSGSAVLNNNGTVSYTAPTSGPDTLTYTVEDQYNDQATGTVNITVDPGPMAGTLTKSVNLGQTVDLTSALLGVDTPGETGDTLSLVGDGTIGTLGSVTFLAGKLTYGATGAGLQHIPANGSLADSFTYVVSDQYGDIATGTASITVTNLATVINGPAAGNAVIQGTSGADIINTHGSNNIIYDNGGNDVVNLGGGNTKVYAGSGDVVVNLNGSNNLVSGGDGWDTVKGGSGNTTVTLGNGNDVVNLGGPNNSITLGNGNDNVTVNGTGEKITAGTGNDTFTLGGSTASLFLHGQHDTVSVNGGRVAITDTPNSTDALMLQMGALGGTVSVANFSAAHAVVLLVQAMASAEGWTTPAQVAASLGMDGHGGSLLSLGAFGSIDFQNVPTTQLTASNFHIG